LQEIIYTLQGHCGEILYFSPPLPFNLAAGSWWEVYSIARIVGRGWETGRGVAGALEDTVKYIDIISLYEIHTVHLSQHLVPHTLTKLS
jgi:hypothetical protein